IPPKTSKIYSLKTGLLHKNKPTIISTHRIFQRRTRSSGYDTLGLLKRLLHVCLRKMNQRFDVVGWTQYDVLRWDFESRRILNDAKP
ncbi:MAG: hypothetical protein CL932_09975, partial [Deltaproteobacteria bacterium]|nr:hypothetical protein [Deltaproteobacteria bacterium]